MKGVVLRVIAFQFVVGAADLIHGVLDLGFIFLQLRLQFGDLERRHHLARFHVGSIINIQLLHVARFLGINVDFLKGHQLRRQSNLPAQGFFHYMGDAYGDGLLGVRLNLPVASAVA